MSNKMLALPCRWVTLLHRKRKAWHVIPLRSLRHQVESLTQLSLKKLSIIEHRSNKIYSSSWHAVPFKRKLYYILLSDVDAEQSKLCQICYITEGRKIQYFIKVQNCINVLTEKPRFFFHLKRVRRVQN